MEGNDGGRGRACASACYEVKTGLRLRGKVENSGSHVFFFFCLFVWGKGVR